jgi:hypothetical protein
MKEFSPTRKTHRLPDDGRRHFTRHVPYNGGLGVVAGETLRAAADIEIADATRESRVRRLAVVDEEGRLVGLVTLDDLLLLFHRELANVATTLDPGKVTMNDKKP